MQVGKKTFELSDYLEAPNSAYYLPTHQAGPDLVGIFSPAHRSNQRYVVFLQAKLTRNFGDKEVHKALITTDPERFYTVRSTGAILTGYEDHYGRVMEALKSFDGYFRVVLAFPLDIQGKGVHKMGKAPFAKIDATNAHLMFEPELLKFLRQSVQDDKNWE
jgi:hypothetical protein